MKRLILIGALVAAALVWIPLSHAQEKQAARVWKYSVLTDSSSKEITKWECPDTEIPAGTKVPDALNLMGADGWELVAVFTTTRTRYVFKR